MPELTKYGLLAYYSHQGTVNFGDYIQSIAARQFLPRVDVYVDRENMASYDGDPIKIILNGWFTHNVRNWIPSKKIEPLFTSFHVNSSAAPFLLDAKGIAYLKEHQPIGCRDKSTVYLLQAKGIEACFSGCLTLTLDHFRVHASERGQDVFVVDPLHNYPTLSTLCSDWKRLARGILSGDILRIHRKSNRLRRIFSPELLRNAVFETHVLPSKHSSEEEAFEYAATLLRKFSKARLVVTSRIHCALPCLALGTPVIFVNGFDSLGDTCRFDGILDLFNRIDVGRNGDITANFAMGCGIELDAKVTNPDIYKPLADRLRQQCTQFIES